MTVIKDLACTDEDLTNTALYVRKVAQHSRRGSHAAKLHFAADIIEAYRNTVLTSVEKT